MELEHPLYTVSQSYIRFTEVFIYKPVLVRLIQIDVHVDYKL